MVFFTEDCVFHEPQGPQPLPRRSICTAPPARSKATHPDFRYQPGAPPAGNWQVAPWVSGRPGEAPAYAGTDFIIALGRPDRRRLSLFRKLRVTGRKR